MFGVASTAPTGVLSKLESETLNCGIGGGSNANFALRIASIFIIGFGSFFGAFLPLLAKRVSWLRIPGAFFDFVKYFGSGVIIATAFIHLLAPAIEALESECLTEAWHEYPYALVLCILSLFCIFILELMAFRWGNAKLAAVGAQRQYNSYRHSSDTAARTYVNHGSEEPRMLTGLLTPTSMENVDSNSEAAQEMSIVASMSRSVDEESGSTSAIGMTPPVKVHSPLTDSAWKRIIGIAVLEFGIVFHSVLIGLTLAVDENFHVLFVVLIFHQTFEGLGIGSRLAFITFPGRPSYERWIPILGAVIYGICTPVGIAVGLGVRTTYNPGSTTASIVSGIMDALSAGILIYSGLVELLAHDFLFNEDMMNASKDKLLCALGSMLLGCAIMALLGRWV